ncbi:hypothetical protein [Streptomyces mangrovisoli]|uniref:Lipoprotein n=1 Tax=Streptomyces mangrovisoli TaxID=1428628 RepID=A0A1J4P6S1_9ACTN|nr:hypothetical protein [Streptomyces mangrovisoli]OIJ69189.1 hypothetical protein WN71_003780 [Streptomyces mangrovisoli]
MPARARRPLRTARAVALAGLLAVAGAGCGRAGGLTSAGATPTAISPQKLWPGLRPAASPAWPYDEAETEVVKGVPVPGDDIRAVDPVAVVRAEIAAHPGDYRGAKAPYRNTATRLGDCATGPTPGADGTAGTAGTGASPGAGAGATRCPLLKAYYRDLTGDGRADMTLGFRLPPTNQTAVRVYTVEGHRLVQVMANDDAVLGVEIAGRSVIIRSPAGISGYEYRTTWNWDPEQRAMVFNRDEFLRTGRRRVSPQPSASRSAAPSASRSAGASASVSDSASPRPAGADSTAPNSSAALAPMAASTPSTATSATSAASALPAAAGVR